MLSKDFLLKTIARENDMGNFQHVGGCVPDGRRKYENYSETINIQVVEPTKDNIKHTIADKDGNQ